MFTAMMAVKPADASMGQRDGDLWFVVQLKPDLIPLCALLRRGPLRCGCDWLFGR